MTSPRSWPYVTIVTSVSYFAALLLLLLVIWIPGLMAVPMWGKGVLSLLALGGAMLAALLAGAVADVVTRKREDDGTRPLQVNDRDSRTSPP